MVFQNEKRKKKFRKETFAVVKHINVVGWMFTDWERGGAFLELLASKRRISCFMN